MGFVGEEIAGTELARLGHGWHVLHGVPVGTGSTDIDHVVIGPGGVFTINTKHHPGGRLQTKGTNTVFVGQTWVPYADRSLSEARRATDLVSVAARFPGKVHPVIAVVGARVDTRQPLDGVTVLRVDELTGWLWSRALELTPGQVEYVFEAARWSSTWSSTQSVPDAPGWIAETARAVAADHVMAQVSRARTSGAGRRSAPGRPQAGRKGPPTRRSVDRRRRGGEFAEDITKLLALAALAIGLFVMSKTGGIDRLNPFPAPSGSASTPTQILGASCSIRSDRAVDASGVPLVCSPATPLSVLSTWQRPSKSVEVLGALCYMRGDHAVDTSNAALVCAPSAPNSVLSTWQRP